MHELSVTENILAIALRHANAAHAAKVTAITLKIGQLASIVDDSVQFYWEILAQDTICAGAELVFERVPALLRCKVCEETFGLERELTPCPSCGSIAVEVIQGEEFYVDSITVESEEVKG